MYTKNIFIRQPDSWFELLLSEIALNKLRLINQDIFLSKSDHKNKKQQVNLIKLFNKICFILHRKFLKNVFFSQIK